MKNESANRTRVVGHFLRQCVNRVILLTGTPLSNRPVELYSQVSILRKDFGKSMYFKKRYCDGNYRNFFYFFRHTTRF